MPYSSIKQLPPQVRKLPVKLQKVWLRVFNQVLPKVNGEGEAFAITWKIIKKKFGNKKIISKSLNFTPTHFTIGEGDGEPVLIKFVMSGEGLDDQNQKLSRVALHSMLADALNKQVFGTIEHAGLRNEVDPLLKQPIMRLVDAKIIDDKMFGTAELLNHPYKEQVLKAIQDGTLNGVSVEILVDTEDVEDGLVRKADLVGFSLVHKPACEDCKVYAIQKKSEAF